MSNKCLPLHLKNKRHNDWIYPFSWIPRSWNAFCLFQPPKLIFGYKVYDWTNKYGQYRIEDNETHWFLDKPGPNPCQRTPNAWYIGFPWYFTWTIFDTGYYIRIGFRWDDNDMYYNLGCAFKRIDGGLKRE